MARLQEAKNKVICDLDGTLTDTETQSDVAMAHVALFEYNFKGDIGSLIERYKGQSWLPLFKELGVHPDHFIDFEARVQYVIRDTQENHGIDLMPGAYEFVNYFHLAGNPVGIGSNSHRSVILERLDRSQPESLLPFVDTKAIVGGNEVKIWRKKPQPDIYKLAAKRAKVRPERCVVIGDNPNDMIAAGRARMARVLISPKEYDGPYEFKPHLQHDSLYEIDPDMIIHLAKRNRVA